MNNAREWKTTFQYFPEIPKVKQWSETSNGTEEQEIYQKLTLQKSITTEEELSIKVAIDFHKNFRISLKYFFDLQPKQPRT